MKNSKKILASLAGLLLLTACFLASPRVLAESNADQTSLGVSDALQESVTDSKIRFQDGVEILKLAEAEKLSLYKDLDAIKKDSKNYRDTTSYSNIIPLNSEEDYINFVLESDKEARLIYFGYETCPYCQAFTPKLNQLAKELDIDIYYYNVQLFQGTTSLDSVMDLYDIETVPYAFVVEKTKPQAWVNHDSSMQEIEDMLVEFANKD